jgi:hypothetical protein
MDAPNKGKFTTYRKKWEHNMLTSKWARFTHFGCAWGKVGLYLILLCWPKWVNLAHFAVSIFCSHFLQCDQLYWWMIWRNKSDPDQYDSLKAWKEYDQNNNILMNGKHDNTKRDIFTASFWSFYVINLVKSQCTCCFIS